MKYMDRNAGKRSNDRKQEPQALFFYPWEKSFERFITPFEQFIERETTSGLLLLLFAAAALIIANSSWHDRYEAFIQTPLAMSLGPWTISHSLLHWVNDGLMVFFFFVVGLEIKREILVGELSNLKGAMLPILAAAGGMLVPALVYRFINAGGDGGAGWGIPMATDIAFCISALVLIGRRIPKALTVFLVALAIVDDLGAVLVIAVFYTKKIEYAALGAAGVLLAALVGMNLSGVRRGVVYLLGGIVLWLLLTVSGIHATIAGVLVAFCIPARERYEPEGFVERLRTLTSRFEEVSRDQRRVLGDVEQGAVLKALDHELHLAEPPIQRMIDRYHLPVALLIIPLFALVNGGVAVDRESLAAVVVHPVTLGVIGGLAAGKCIGISLFSWLAVITGIASLPAGVTMMRHIVGAGFLAGIGFTMSIFISDLSFGDLPQLHALAKTGIILGSLLSGALGIIWLMAASGGRKEPAPNSGGAQ
jgi:NhaA family Na+:H+ antiporter